MESKLYETDRTEKTLLTQCHIFDVNIKNAFKPIPEKPN